MDQSIYQIQNRHTNNSIDLISKPYYNSNMLSNSYNKLLVCSIKGIYEWEHIFPVSKAIGAFSECRGKGYLDKKTGKRKNLSRKKCLKVSEGFRKLEANLFNLVPAVGSLNAVRSNYSFAEIEGEHREWGKCDFEKVGRKIEPQDSVKGDIARVYFYLEKEYPHVGVISKKNRKLFEVWDKMDSVSKEECEINKLKSKYQGNENLFVSKHCNKY